MHKVVLELMKKNRKHFINILLLILIAGTVTLMTGSTNPGRHESPVSEVPYLVTSPKVPRQVTFAGKEIDLTRYDRRERMDRELTGLTYTHGNTMLMIKRANRYFPLIEPVLAMNGIPDDFKYLMTIESDLNIQARSPAGAAGLWQMLEATGRENGLEVNPNVDERYHVIKSTEAACRYLRKAYAKYGDWMTVAASYNAGQGRISGELDKQAADDAMDLWLNQETSRYMFRILAIKQIFGNPRQYGFLLKRENLYPVIASDVAVVDSGIADLAAYARQMGITYAQLKDANPWLRDRSLENKSRKTYLLTIPTPEGMNYDPQKTAVHDRKWIAD